MTRASLASILCGLAVACNGSAAVVPPDSGPGSYLDGDPPRFDDGTPSSDDDVGPTCGFCYGDNCCCTGMDTDCDPGYACYIDGFCDPMGSLPASLWLNQGEVATADPSGQAWDPDGPPDLVVVVSVNGAEVHRTSALTDTSAWSQGDLAPIDLVQIDDKTPLLIQIFDQDDGQETLVAEARWDQGVPSWLLQSDAVDVVPLLTPPPQGLVKLVLDVAFRPAY
jgi:hypothetical protein